MNFRETLKSIGIIPVIQINDAEKAVPLALALKKGGLPAAEVTFRTDAAEYLALPNVLCCGGSWMVPGKLLDAGDFDAIEALAREAAQIVKK